MARQRNKPSKAEQCRRAKGALRALRQRANPTWYVNFGVGFIGCYMLLHISGLSFLRKALIFWNYRCQNKDIRIDWNVNVPLTRHLLNAPDISAPFGFASKGEVSTTPEIGHVITLHTFGKNHNFKNFTTQLYPGCLHLCCIAVQDPNTCLADSQQQNGVIWRRSCQNMPDGSSDQRHNSHITCTKCLWLLGWASKQKSR